MKKHMKTLACALLIASLLTSCGAKSDKGGIITIAISDEANEYKTALIQSNGKELLEEEYFEQTMQSVAGRGEQILPEYEAKNALACEKFEGSNVYTLTNEDYENVILYIHGGAWVFEITTAHVKLCDNLATRLNAKVYMPLYPLAPEANGEETFAMIEGLYREILKEGKNVYLMGDSAGGEISLGLMHIIKEKGLTKPKKTVLLAPCSDMTFSNAEMATLDETDPVLASYGCRECARMWAGEENLKNPKYSALYADVSGYPDTMIVAGTCDILSPDNYLLYQKLKEAGVNATLVMGEGLWHVFAAYPIPERETVLNLIEDFCTE